MEWSIRYYDVEKPKREPKAKISFEGWDVLVDSECRSFKSEEAAKKFAAKWDKENEAKFQQEMKEFESGRLQNAAVVRKLENELEDLKHKKAYFARGDEAKKAALGEKIDLLADILDAAKPRKEVA